MPGLQLVGPIAGKPRTPGDDKNAVYEKFGMFVIGDAYAIRHYSGLYPGWRWLCKAQGPLIDTVGVWPTPGGYTSSYFTDGNEARAMYAQLRQHAMAMAPGLRAEDARSRMPLNDPNCHAESFFQGNEEVLRLFWDHMADLQVALSYTQMMDILVSNPADHSQGQYLTYHSQNDVLYVAIATGPGGGVEHLCLIYSDSHKTQPTIQDGMPRAEWVKATQKGALRFPTGIAVAQWGRLGGNEAQWAEDPQNPLGSMIQKMGNRPFAPLPPPSSLAPRLGDVPAAYAFRMEPGEYTATYYELTTERFGGFSFVAVSREGAPSFLPVVLGNAGGMVHGGLTMEQYAQLSAERDALLMRGGAGAIFGNEMAALCHKYNVPFQQGPGAGMNGRINEWEQMIQRDPAFSAQWAMQIGVARLKLQGIEPTQAHLDQIAQQQQQTQNFLEEQNKKQASLKNEISSAAHRLIQGAPQWSVQQIVSAVASFAPSARPSDVLYHVLVILKNPDDHGKTEGADKITDKLARAHWATLSEEDRKFEGGKEDKYVKDVIADVYEKQGLPVPGVGGFFSRLLDKL